MIAKITFNKRFFQRFVEMKYIATVYHKYEGEHREGFKKEKDTIVEFDYYFNPLTGKVKSTSWFYNDIPGKEIRSAWLKQRKCLTSKKQTEVKK